MQTLDSLHTAAYHSTAALILRCLPACPAALQEPAGISEDQLPLRLPDTDDFKPSGTPDPPLAKISEWVNTTDGEGRPARRETSTMPQWAGSCWYYLRYIDPHNTDRCDTAVGGAAVFLLLLLLLVVA